LRRSEREEIAESRTERMCWVAIHIKGDKIPKRDQPTRDRRSERES
jgi:hypothetical protein